MVAMAIGRTASRSLQEESYRESFTGASSPQYTDSQIYTSLYVN